MIIKVECHSGFKGNERPLRFTLDGCMIEVRDVMDRWYGPGCSYFKVEGGDGGTYILRYDEERDEWDLKFFRARKG